MPIKAVIFDLDGVIIDSEPAYRKAWSGAARELGYEIPVDFYDTTTGIPNSEGELLLAKLFGKDFPLASFCRLWQRAFMQIVSSGDVRLKSGVEEILREIELYGLKKAIATSSALEEIQRNPVAFSLLNRFDTVTTSDDIARAKPFPDIFIFAAEKLHVSPSEALVLEDSNNGMRAALAAGCISVMVPDIVPPDPDVTERAFAVVASLTDAIAIIGNLL